MRSDVVVYNVDDEATGLRLSLAEAQREVDAGNAHWLRSRRGNAVQLTAWDRCDPSPSGLPMRTMTAAAGGARTPRAKVRAWGELQRENFRRLLVPA